MMKIIFYTSFMIKLSVQINNFSCERKSKAAYVRLLVCFR